MREGVFQVGGCGSRFDSHLHSPTHQRSVVQTGLGSSVFNPTTSTLLLPGESPGSQTPPGLISTKGQHRTQNSFLQRPAGKRQLVRRQGRATQHRGTPSRVPTAVHGHRSTVACSIAGHLWVLLFTGIQEEERLGQSVGTAGKGLAQTLAHVSGRSGARDGGCSTSKGSSSSSRTDAVPGLRQRSLRGSSAGKLEGPARAALGLQSQAGHGNLPGQRAQHTLQRADTTGSCCTLHTVAMRAKPRQSSNTSPSPAVAKTQVSYLGFQGTKQLSFTLG